MARHETEMHRERRELVAYLREIAQRQIIDWHDMPSHIRQIVMARSKPFTIGLFSDDASQTDLVDRSRKCT